MKYTGCVKSFIAEKGYGFIEVEGMNDVFVHYSGIIHDGYRVLHEGDIVEFEINKERGIERAVNVRTV